MGQGGGCRHHGNRVAKAQHQQPRCLPTPTVSQCCLFFPGPGTMEPAAPSPVTLGDLTLQCPPVTAGWVPAPILHWEHARGQGAGSVLTAGAMEPVAQGAAGLAACRAEAPTGSARPWLTASCRQGDPGQESGTTDLSCTRDSGPHPYASTAPCCCPHSHCAPQLPWPYIPIPVGPLPCAPPPDPTAP